MTEQQLSLLPFYAGWGRYQQRLVAAIAPLTGRAACPAHHAAPLVDWHVRDAYCR